MVWIQLAQNRVHGNEPSGSIKHGNVADRLSDYQLLTLHAVMSFEWFVYKL